MVRVADEQRHLAQADCHITEAENLLEMLHQSLALVHAHRQMILRAFGK